MSLAGKLLGFLNRAFDKDPAAFLALRLQYDGAMQWQVAEGRLVTKVQGGSGMALSVDLSLYTVRELAGFLSLQRGYSVPFSAGAGLEAGDAAALRLLDGAGDIHTSNGDHLLAYTSLLYAWLAAQAQELYLARAAIGGIAAELSTTTADASWLDYQGSFYGVVRFPGEPDRLYGPRIITEVLRPAGNNVALEAAIRTYTGQPVSILDAVLFRAPEPRFDGLPFFDGAYDFQPTVQPVYGLFDAVVGYDILNGDVPTSFVASVRAIIERLRDAGTQLRNFRLAGSALSDLCPLPSDDVDELTIFRAIRFDGSRAFDGSATFAGATAEIGTIEGGAAVVSALPTGLALAVLADGLVVGVEVRGRDALTYGVTVPYDPLAV